MEALSRLLSLAGFAIGTILFFVYYFAKAAVKWPDTVDGLFTIVVMSVSGTVITTRAKLRDRENGLVWHRGLVLLVLSWLIVAVVNMGMMLFS
jgi:hypothetical protein